MSKTNSGLIAYAKAQLGMPYWYGTFGNIATAELHSYKKKQYPKYYTATDFPKQYGKRVHDCVGIVKGYMWSDTPTSTPKYVAAQDVSAPGMYKAATEKGKIATFRGVAGQLVFKGDSVNGIHHVGVYGGDGYVYEAKGHAYGVVKTPYKASEWQYWCQCPYIVNDTEKKTTQPATPAKPAEPAKPAAWTPKVGDIVKYTGTVHYASANTIVAKHCKGGKAKITSIYQLGKSKHPYHLKAVAGGGSTVYGWVNAGTFTKA